MLSTSSNLLAAKQPPTVRAMTYDPYLTNSAASNEAKVPEFLRPLPKPAARYTAGEVNNFMPSYGAVRMMGKMAYPHPHPGPHLHHHHHPLQQDDVAVNLMHKQAGQLPLQYFPSHAYSNTPPLYFNSAMPHQFSLQPQQQPPRAFNLAPSPKMVPARAPPPPPPVPPPPPQQPFKVPSGKEGSMKHRLLTPGRAEEPPKKTKSHFARGSLIKLTNERVVRIEDIRTEDFVFAAEKCPALRLDPSTVVRIAESVVKPQQALVVLRYGPDQQHQIVEMEVVLEHPFFVYGKGWCSVSPERSLTSFDLPCVRLSVGDTCVSLSPRLPAPTAPASLKRRWSAPDHAALLLQQDCASQDKRTKHSADVRSRQ
ncbi:amyloid beta A4 precursor protein-binding family B member 1-interacting protein [Neocloeon triangulifer]|uniref:amyloid beta A4 precursor protein-binding family B member 1-interacting protein n=1 Tax=Neocloeon triangulifer TaxID=2078957 RepID=UPI00286EF9E5|nr:amyloid beta A4 precursor protein-binding family B member 1-interacting protein [Neocloeon triangulifer]XP_059488995.1 amyloid beta A4 precursor protein-binding family B member 1-interacting protein [Neocloeon triangulifer]